MADSKISALTSATTPLAGTEVLPIVQSSTTKQVSVANLTAGRSVAGLNFIPSGSAVPTNGLYLPAANSVGLATNSANAIAIDSAQRVGVGVLSPSAQFHVQNANGNNGLGSDNTGMALVESTYAGNAGDANASFIAKNYYGYGQFMQWQNYGMRVGSRATANGGAGEVVFTYGNDTEGMRLTSSGNLAFPSGKGIDFSATSNTGTSELFADYEEGTWTPVVTSGAGSITTLGGLITGQYTKVGNLVTIIFTITITTNGTGSLNLQVSGLPYTPAAYYNCGAFRDFGGITSKMGSVGIVASSTTFIMLYYDGTYPGANNVYLAGSATYQV